MVMVMVIVVVVVVRVTSGNSSSSSCAGVNGVSGGDRCCSHNCTCILRALFSYNKLSFIEFSKPTYRQATPSSVDTFSNTHETRH